MVLSPARLISPILLTPKLFSDDRGYFFESYNQAQFEATIGHPVTFVQDNQSRSKQHVLRGLHYQIIQPQGKLIRVLSGSIYDIAVDIRQNSPTFGQWVAYELSSDNPQQLWIPPGFAHGFLTLSDSAEVLYKTTDYYCPQGERTLLWNDPDLNIPWPLQQPPLLSPKDQVGTPFKNADLFP